MPLLAVQIHFMVLMVCLRARTSSSFRRIRTEDADGAISSNVSMERWLFRDKFNGGLLRTFSKRRHTENFNRPLGISVRFVFKRLYSSITTFFADHPNFDVTTTLLLSDIMFIGCSISTYI